MESNYSSLITPPKFSQVNVGQNIYDIGEYRKILNGENSRRMPGITHPVGRVYVAETGIMCNDIKTGQSVPRHTIIDVKMSKGKTGKNGILDSAYSDFDAAGSSNIFEDANRKFSDKCMSVDINEIDKFILNLLLFFIENTYTSYVKNDIFKKKLNRINLHSFVLNIT